MAAEIAIGSRIHIKVLKTPRSVAARKTLLRVLMKDNGHRKRHEVNRRHRRTAIQRRRHAGRPWYVIPRKALPVTGAPGEEATILATADVVADLKGLQEYLEIEPV